MSIDPIFKIMIQVALTIIVAAICVAVVAYTFHLIGMIPIGACL